MGEFLAVQPVIDALLEDETVEVVLTTTTITSQQIAQERYGARVLLVGYFPIDFWPWMSAAWESLQPDLMLLTEGEWWPEHLAQAKRRGVPVLGLNARMSDRSFGRMRMVRPLLAGCEVRTHAVAGVVGGRCGEIPITRISRRTGDGHRQHQGGYCDQPNCGQGGE